MTFIFLVALAGCYWFVTSSDVADAMDRDGDGVSYVDDCDDSDSSVGLPVVWYPDTDRDGYGDMGAEGLASCEDLSAGGFSTDHTDCNDADAAIHPDAEERCDDVDNDCNGAVDESTGCQGHDTDADGDGFAADVDCDDSDSDAYPNAVESPYDGVDQDCDGQDLTDVDRDGHDALAAGGDDCDDADSAIYPGAEELCDGVDNDCTGVADDADDADGDLYTECTGDCDDVDSGVNPNVYDGCDGVDNDCDGTVDPYNDADGDGWSTCMDPPDCNDAASEMHPGAEEVCDGIDNDCNGQEDEGFDLDGDGYASCGGDCDDTDPDIHPGAEEVTGDAVDSNCDGLTER